MIDKKRVLVVIPARMGGYRYPDKPLRKLNGMAMIEWVYKHASKSKYADKVVISTPDDSIIEFCKDRNLDFDKTSASHRRGTERVNETFKNLGSNYEVIVNFQGDEPLVLADDLDRAIECLIAEEDIACVNLFKMMSYTESEIDQNEVKVVTDVNNNALYFSRNPLPAKWLGDKTFECKVEICVMPMTNESLTRFVNLPNCYYEEIESVDMLRFVENGLKVRMLETKAEIKSVDCEEDRVEAERMLIKQYGVL
ncbi:3-deoxy-manno-octulosonate cytidylyltransferase [Leptospira biflexa]|uniref:3-deoxy-manno-octulosonate cytidylyltransferase n=1 Tax=Leptospira biflexa TaxID=172 RepID=UPI00108378D2|nr:3-deoxy-manno-octulosonate cytidylyltransferase [Leptospira biflexa]TGM31732.1 3-deoxy-manno-octulosonate cytidylyltransferase [Leptospira biflexa]TGM39109.1 3-deoxy-manno-octulosonate cytidylyltransferase [Leptospira biflexa]